MWKTDPVKIPSGNAAGGRFCSQAQAVQLIDLQLFGVALLNQGHFCPFPALAPSPLLPCEQKGKIQHLRKKKYWLNFYLTKHPAYAVSSVSGKFCTSCAMCLSPSWKISISEMLQAVSVAQKTISWACVTSLYDLKDYQWLGWCHSQRLWGCGCSSWRCGGTNRSSQEGGFTSFKTFFSLLKAKCIVEFVLF